MVKRNIQAIGVRRKEHVVTKDGAKQLSNNSLAIVVMNSSQSVDAAVAAHLAVMQYKPKDRDTDLSNWPTEMQTALSHISIKRLENTAKLEDSVGAVGLDLSVAEQQSAGGAFARLPFADNVSQLTRVQLTQAFSDRLYGLLAWTVFIASCLVFLVVHMTWEVVRVRQSEVETTDPEIRIFFARSPAVSHKMFWRYTRTSSLLSGSQGRS